MVDFFFGFIDYAPSFSGSASIEELKTFFMGGEFHSEGRVLTGSLNLFLRLYHSIREFESASRMVASDDFEWAKLLQ